MSKDVSHQPTSSYSMASVPSGTVLSPSPFDLRSYPSHRFLHCLAAVVAHMVAENDKLCSALPTAPPFTVHTSATLVPAEPPMLRTLTTAFRTTFADPNSRILFDTDHLPTISLEAYLLRILKYCPTTTEVFLSILVWAINKSWRNGRNPHCFDFQPCNDQMFTVFALKALMAVLKVPKVY
ncbi:hypothetical protein B0H10DRAFT_2277535 [Mycena sp. CBHHK59/15]|nr:hypothetical protein B0H10DRAFT_2277535 [Mycena sp. CBHHK59/15]